MNDTDDEPPSDPGDAADERRRKIERDRLVKIVDELREHWECVHIVVSRYEPDTGSNDGGGTYYLDHGKGHWFARLEHMRKVLVREDAKDRMLGGYRPEEDG